MPYTNKIKPIFKDKRLQSLFENNGFVKVPLLSQAQTNELTILFDDTRIQHAKVNTIHHTTTDTMNRDLINLVDSKIKSVCQKELEKILWDYKPLIGCFHIKEPGSNSETGIHQDPTFVDESKYYSANVWIALQDIDDKNGNLFFISGSNRIESFRVIPDYPSYYNSFRDLLPKIAVPVPLKKGEAVIFNNATIHAATANFSNEVRLAATLLVCSAPAEWLLYYKDVDAPNDKIEEYHIDLGTFIAIPKNGRPDNKSFRRYISASFPQITKNEFLKKSRQNDDFVQKMKNLFRVINAL